jgi:hypothetical protein
MVGSEWRHLRRARDITPTFNDISEIQMLQRSLLLSADDDLSLTVLPISPV